MALLHSQAWKLKSARKSQCVTAAMMRRLRSYGSPESVEPGGHLFQQGERLVDFFVVEQGELELYERKGRASCEVDVHPGQVALHRRARFAERPPFPAQLSRRQK